MILTDERLNELIKEAMKSGEKVKLDTLRSIKTAYMEFRTAKNAGPLDNAAEIKILRKMAAQREDAKNEYLGAGRTELAKKEAAEEEIIKSFLPAEVGLDEIIKAASEIVREKDMKLMGGYIKALKEKFPTADGKMLSEVVRELMK